MEIKKVYGVDFDPISENFILKEIVVAKQTDKFYWFNEREIAYSFNKRAEKEKAHLTPKAAIEAHRDMLQGKVNSAEYDLRVARNWLDDFDNTFASIV